MYYSLFIFLADGCHTYQNLKDAERKYDHSKADSKCDHKLSGWYRFQGAAGTRMATTSPGRNKCGASFPAWLKGRHPKEADGTVKRKVCIHKFDSDCDVSRLIDVKNCGSYYIYKFIEIDLSCNFRYCGTD